MAEGQINESGGVRLFRSYFSQDDLTVQDTIEAVLQECSDAGMAVEDRRYVLDCLLIPEATTAFASLYDSLSKQDTINNIFQTFCEAEGLDDTLQTKLALAIVTAASQNDEEDYQGDESDGDEKIIFRANQWAEMSDEERQHKIEAFVRRLASAHRDMQDIKPFLKKLAMGANPYGVNNGADKYQEFKRKEHRFGHSPSNESVSSPSCDGTGFDELHRAHPLHKTLSSFGYRYDHTVPVTGQKGNVHHYHVWSHPTAGHQIGSYEGDTKFSSKTHAGSGHVFTGIGVKALSQHLRNRAKKYKLDYWGSVRHTMQDNEEALPATKIMEALADNSPEALARVKFYARWMASDTPTDYNPNNQKADLLEAAKLKRKHDAVFNRDGKDQSEWGLLDFRSGKPR